MRAQSGGKLGALYVDGGPSQNRFLMQCVSNLIEHAVIQCEAPEASALGAAYLAGLSLGLWKDLNVIEALPRSTEVIRPEEINRIGLLNTWNDALARSTSRPTPVKCE